MRFAIFGFTTGSREIMIRIKNSPANGWCWTTKSFCQIRIRVLWDEILVMRKLTKDPNAMARLLLFETCQHFSDCDLGLNYSE